MTKDLGFMSWDLVIMSRDFGFISLNLGLGVLNGIRS